MMIYNCVIHEVLTVKNDNDQHFNCSWPNKYSEEFKTIFRAHSGTCHFNFSASKRFGCLANTNS